MSIQQQDNLLLFADEQTADSSPLHVIRTETVLSRLPIHSLSKTADFAIRIVRRRPNGELELYWAVSHSAQYGPPRQLAYKLDTLIVNRRIDEAKRPLPKIFCLGSLRDIARELDLGGDTNSIRKALRQNAFTGISAKLSYRSTDGCERRIEADFTRYSVVFAGEKLPDGRTADAVYLILTDPYLEVLNHAPFRPLDYDYLKLLAPAAQRFYEVVSYRIYTALKYGRPTARMLYSDFCTFSALRRYTDYEHFKKQMYKIQRPHLESGYLAEVCYEDTCDGEGNPDWVLIYTPGPRAKREFATFQKHDTGEGRPPIEAEAAPADGPQVGAGLLEELTRRGITASQAKRLLAHTADSQSILRQLAWGDHLIRQSRDRIQNPPGFYAYIIQENILPPEDFVAPGEPARPACAAADPAAEVAYAYEQYRRQEIERQIQSRYTPAQYSQALERKASELRKLYRSADYWNEEDMRQLAEAALRAEVARETPLMSWEEFARGHSRKTNPTYRD